MFCQLPARSFLFVSLEPAFGRAHQVGRAALAQEFEVVVADDAAVKDPEAAGFSKLLFDRVEDMLQRRSIEAVAGEDFAARGEEAVDGEQFEDFIPRHVAGVIGQRVAPEGVEAEAFPELGGRPTVAEAAGRLHREGGELDLDHVGVVGGGLVTVGEETLLPALAVLVENINGVLPGIQLGGVEFARWST